MSPPPISPDALPLAKDICQRHGNDPALLIEILHDLQDALGYIPEQAEPVIAEALNIAKAEVHGVVSFYHDFRTQPPVGPEIKLCQGEACQAVGARAVMAALTDRPDLSIFGATVTPVYCLGNCALGPAAMLQQELLGRVDAEGLAIRLRRAAP